MPDPNIENRAREIESVIKSGRPVSILKRKWLDNYRAGRLKVYDHDTNELVFYQPAPTGISLPTAPLTPTPVPTATPTPVPSPAPAIPSDRTALRSMAQLFTGNPDAEIRAPVRPDAPSSFLSQGVEGLQTFGELLPFLAEKTYNPGWLTDAVPFLRGKLTPMSPGPIGEAFGAEQSRTLTELSAPLVARLLKTNPFSEEAAILRSQIAQINEQRPFMHQMANIIDVLPLGAGAKFIKGLRGTKAAAPQVPVAIAAARRLGRTPEMATQASPPVTTELRLTRQAELPPPTLPPQPPSPRSPEEIQLDIDFIMQRQGIDPGVKTDMLDSLHTELIQAASARPIGAAPIGARATQMALPAPAERLALPPSPARLALAAPAERLALPAPAARLALADPAAQVSPMPSKQTVPVPNSELLPQPAPFRVTKEGQALLPGQEIPSTPVKPRPIPPPEIPTNPRAGPDDPIPIIPPGAPATFAGQMPEEKADEILRWFADFLDSPENVEAWEITKIWRTAARSRRGAALQERAAELIDEGISYKGAMKKAIDESFSGKLPEATTSLPSVATPEVHDALFSKLYHVLADEPFEMAGTFEALSNALMGKPIPRDPGVKGGSAFSRLQRVFPPKIMEALAENKQLAFQIGIRAGRAPRPPARQYIPKDLDPKFYPLQKQFDLLDLTGNIWGRPMSITNPNMYNIPEQGVLENPQQFRMFETPPVFQEPRPNLKTKVERELDNQAYKVLFAKREQLRLHPDGRVKIKHIPGATDSDMLALEQLALWDDAPKRRALKAMAEAGWTAIDIGNFVRANMSSLDISWLRQGVLLIPSHPIKFTRAFADSFISLFSERWAQKVMKDIQAGPAHRRFYDKYNLDYQRPLDMKTLRKYGRVEGEPLSRAEGLSDIAEEYMALGGERLIPRFTQKLPWIRMSGRAHVVGINKLTSSIFEMHYRNLLDINESRGFWGKFGTVLDKDAGAGFSIDENMRAVGRMLEDMSGRGPIPERLKGLTPAMNAGLFSLRLTLGRIRSPIHLFKGTRYSRLQAWRYMVTGVTSISSALFVGRELGLWDLETDSHSADFMKILFLDGRIRVDPWGGYQQYAVLLSRLATLSMKSSITGEITDSVDPIRLAAQFGKNKFSPGAAAILEAWVGEDFIGREIDRTDWLRWIRTRSPMAAMDIYETLGADGLMGTFKGSGAIIGGGVQVYDLPRWNDMDIYYNIKEGITAQDITERWSEYEPFFDIDNTSTILSDKQRRKAREQFRSDPWNEARLFVRNRVTTLSSEAAKGYAEELIDKYQISPRDIRGYEKYIQGDLKKSSKKQKELDSRLKNLIGRIR